MVLTVIFHIWSQDVLLIIVWIWVDNLYLDTQVGSQMYIQISITNLSL